MTKIWSTKTIILTLAMLLVGCSGASKEKKKWEPDLDQHFQDSRGNLSFGRTHHLVEKTDAMNKMRTNQVKAFMRKVCKDKEAAIIRTYFTESDFVSLKGNYPRSVQIKVFEFNCRR
jgi:hypothetical protein